MKLMIKNRHVSSDLEISRKSYPHIIIAIHNGDKTTFAN